MNSCEGSEPRLLALPSFHLSLEKIKKHIECLANLVLKCPNVFSHMLQIQLTTEKAKLEDQITLNGGVWTFFLSPEMLANLIHECGKKTQEEPLSEKQLCLLLSHAHYISRKDVICPVVFQNQIKMNCEKTLLFHLVTYSEIKDTTTKFLLAQTQLAMEIKDERKRVFSQPLSYSLHAKEKAFENVDAQGLCRAALDQQKFLQSRTSEEHSRSSFHDHLSREFRSLLFRRLGSM